MPSTDKMFNYGDSENESMGDTVDALLNSDGDYCNGIYTTLGYGTTYSLGVLPKERGVNLGVGDDPIPYERPSI